MINNLASINTSNHLLDWLKFLLRFLGIAGISINLIVTALLVLSDKYYVEIPNLPISGNLVLALYLVVQLATLSSYLLDYKNIILSFIANSVIITIPLYLFQLLRGTYNDDSLIFKSKWFKIYYTFSLEEKKEWVARLGHELHKDLTQFATDDVLTQVNSYNTFKKKTIAYIETLNQKPYNSEASSLLNFWNWAGENKIIIGTVIVVAVGVACWFASDYLITFLKQKADAEMLKIQERNNESIAVQQTALNKLNRDHNAFIDSYELHLKNCTSTNSTNTSITSEQMADVTDNLNNTLNEQQQVINNLSDKSKQTFEVLQKAFLDLENKVASIASNSSRELALSKISPENFHRLENEVLNLGATFQELIEEYYEVRIIFQETMNKFSQALGVVTKQTFDISSNLCERVRRLERLKVEGYQPPDLT